MTAKANIPRKLAAEILIHDVDGLQKKIGMLVKTYRAFIAPDKESETQTDIATKVGGGLTQPLISSFENGALSSVPAASLNAYLDACGLDTSAPGGKALKGLIDYLRDNGKDLEQITTEMP